MSTADQKSITGGTTILRKSFLDIFICHWCFYFQIKDKLKDFNDAYCEDNEVELPEGAPVFAAQAPRGSPWTEGPDAGNSRRKRSFPSIGSETLDPNSPDQNNPYLNNPDQNNPDQNSPALNGPALNSPAFLCGRTITVSSTGIFCITRSEKYISVTKLLLNVIVETEFQI